MYNKNNLKEKENLVVLDQILITSFDVLASHIRKSKRRNDTHKEVIMETLLDSRATNLVMSSDFAKKQKFKLKKIGRPIYMRNIDGSFNKGGLIEYTVEVNIYCQRYKERIEIDIIREQK